MNAFSELDDLITVARTVLACLSHTFHFFFNLYIYFSIVFLGGHIHEGEFSKALDESLPYSLHYKYWIKPENVPSFTERLKNFFFENPHRITLEDLPSLSRVSQPR
jgi:hypothetical protein